MYHCYVYYEHSDGDRMVLTMFEGYQADITKPTVIARFTPHHKVSVLKSPLLFPTLEQAEQWIADFGHVVPDTLKVASHLSMDYLRRLPKYHREGGRS